MLIMECEVALFADLLSRHSTHTTEAPFTQLYESLIEVVRLHVPKEKLVFNRKPNDAVDASKRSASST